MMLNLFHLMTGCSLVEISAISKMSQIGDISDVAFMKRFKNCNNWFKWIIEKIVTGGMISYEIPNNLKDYRVLALDASEVKEKGRTGRTYRLHFALDIFKYNNHMKSIWRETKFVKLLIISNALNIPETLSMAICFLQIEKKRKQRILQLTKMLS